MENADKRYSTKARRTLILIVVAITLASVGYRLLVVTHLEQTSLLFVGIPAFIAIVTTFARPKSVAGAIIVAITIALCVSGIFLGEGFICIVMASPLFYLVGAVIGDLIDHSRKKKQEATMTCLLLLAFLPLSIEGTSPKLSLAREETVSTQRIVNSTSENVESALSRSPQIEQSLPVFLRLRFPRPVEAHGGGLMMGDVRIVHFAGGEGKPGDLIMAVREARPGYVRFEMVSDKSKIAHWLTWRSAEFEWQPIDATHTSVRCTMKFRRDLDPAWYFRPWERYAVRLAADYLISANATPATESGRQ
jgi:hypothetical protein